MNLVEVKNKKHASKMVLDCYRRVTQDLINCNVLIISSKNLDYVDSGCILGGINKYEYQAKRYYEKLGFNVFRLDRNVNGVGENEDIFPESKIIGDVFRSVFTKEDYLKLIHKKRCLLKSISLNGIDPKDYPLICYVPDFLVVDFKTGKWKFVEVKSYRDKLHFKQANWYVNLIPKHWEYEIFAQLKQEFDEIYNCSSLGPRKGEQFQRLYQLESDKALANKRSSESFKKTGKIV